MSYKQIKLISGEEIICEVVYQPDEKTDDQTMVIRMAAELSMYEDMEEAVRFYSFRPYMMYINNQEQLITLNGNNITSITTPHPTMMKQYKEHFNQIDYQENNLLDSDSPPNVVKFKPTRH